MRLKKSCLKDALSSAWFIKINELNAKTVTENKTPKMYFFMPVNKTLLTYYGLNIYKPGRKKFLKYLVEYYKDASLPAAADFRGFFAATNTFFFLIMGAFLFFTGAEPLSKVMVTGLSSSRCIC
jgi:hypothetical protein